MKKYITPNTESISIMTTQMMQSYTPSDGLGGGSQYPPENPTPTTPTF